MSTAPFGGTMQSPQPWLDLVMPSLPGAAPDNVKSRLLECVRTFCREGLAWVVERKNITVPSGSEDFAIPTGVANTEVCWVLRLLVEGQKYEPQTRVNGFTIRNRNGGPADTGYRYTQTQPGLIQFMKPLENTVSIDALVAIAPRTLNVPDWFLSRYGKVIAEGCGGEMMQIENMPWSNPRNGLKWERRLVVRRKRVRLEALHAYQLVDNSWAFPRFGA